MEFNIQFLAAIAAILVVVVPLAKYIWKHTVYKTGNFQIVFIDHFPLPQFTTDPIEEPPHSVKLIPPGTYKLFLKVVALHGFQVKKINLRCLNSDLTNASKSNVTITEVIDPFYPSLFSATPDGNWGVDGEYSEVRALAQGAGLYYEITLNAMQNWSGHLSFRAENSDALRSAVRHSIEIRDGADQPPAYVEYQVPAILSQQTATTPQTNASKLRIEFRENDNQFLQQEPYHATLSGMKYAGLIALHNETQEPIDQVRIVIGGIVPVRQGSRNFNVVRHASDGVTISIAPRDRQFITLFEFIDIHNDCLLHVTCEDATPGSGEEFVMKLRVTGRNVSEPIRLSLRFGYRDGKFFMKKT